MSSHNPHSASYEQRIATLESEVARLQRGDFTPEELQEICHNLDDTDKLAFFAGCVMQQRALFGESHIEWIARCAKESCPAIRPRKDKGLAATKP